MIEGSSDLESTVLYLFFIMHSASIIEATLKLFQAAYSVSERLLIVCFIALVTRVGVNRAKLSVLRVCA